MSIYYKHVHVVCYSGGYINRSGKKNRSYPELLKPTVRLRPENLRLSIGSTWSIAENCGIHQLVTFTIFQKVFSGCFEKFQLILDITLRH